MPATMVVQPSNIPKSQLSSLPTSKPPKVKVTGFEMSHAASGEGHNKRPRHSVPTIPTIVLTPPLEICEVMPAFPNKKRHSLPCGKSSSHEDLSEFALPGLDEADEIDGNEFRPRTGSAGLKTLIKLKNRHKSGDCKSSPPEDRKGIKGFLDSIRPRSKSDAATSRQVNLMRKKHPSGGQTGTAAVRQVLNHDQQHMLGSGDLEPMQRPRSTSLGAKDRLRMIKDMRVTGGAGPDKTMMGKIISNGLSQHNGLSTGGSDKTSLSGSMSSVDQTEHHYTGRALIWSEQDQYQDGDASADFERLQIEDIEENDPLVFNKFMRAHKCYDIIPNSGKLIVFDTSLSVKKAFYALVYNCVRSAPLWDNKTQQFIGMLTITDFIMILHKYYKSPQEKMQELAEHQISSWRKELGSHYKPFVSISPEESVCAAVRKLAQTKVHRLPVLDPVSGNAVYIITHKRILKFMHIFTKNLPKPTYFNESIEYLGIGTYGDIVSVGMESKLIDALGLFVKHRVSALPVVDEHNRVVDIYAKFDVLNLAAEKTYNNLDVTIAHSLRHRQQKSSHVMVCHRNDSLAKVIEIIVKAGVHRLVIVGDDDVMEGIVSLSDLLTFLLQENNQLSNVMSKVPCTFSLSSESPMQENPSTITATC
ncbi:5'-AMP-activated protein kinase subunit gamma-like isoform X2 [Watersipora subatra]|uniref:5'-AMP-activated protein kinase subunit gamma-like isoform X2 n=1 Tax=Watersipora subatra TaxID=2589382 RepID=UPI00355B913D